MTYWYYHENNFYPAEPLKWSCGYPGVPGHTLRITALNEKGCFSDD